MKGTTSSSTLAIEDISQLRVRDIKRRLARHHGYSAEELASKLDKKELIQALAYEEEKIRRTQDEETKRNLVKQGILIALLAVALVIFWPLIRHGWEVLSINFVVYTDRKQLEIQRCRELKTFTGFLGVLLMVVVDGLQAWLSISVLLSWVMRSRFFFPTPSLSIKPAQLMGEQMARSSLGEYGINIGPVIIGWALRFLRSKLELWTGMVMSKALKKQRKVQRANETPEEKELRRAAKKEAKERPAPSNNHHVPMDLPPEWMQPSSNNHNLILDSKAHEAFLNELEVENSQLDDLD